jgi:DNA polymerase III delta' subunit
MAWDKFLDQSRAISILKSYINLNQVSGSFIFSGPKGVGKFSIAKEFAKSSNCLNSPGDSCSLCSNCIQIEKESHPDLYIIRPADKSDEITIDMIRELQKFLNLSPANANRKFFIIDQAEKMNIESANAFLKSLEEPPLDSVIILVSSRVSAIIPTIRSRCKELKFRPLSVASLKTILKDKLQLNQKDAEKAVVISGGGLDFESENIDLTDLYSDLKAFFFSLSFRERGDRTPLYQHRKVLKAKIRSLTLYIRDILCIVNGADSLTLFIDSYSRDGVGSKDLIEKIEKLEYLYSALDSNVNPDFIYKIARAIYKEVSVKSEVHS